MSVWMHLLETCAPNTTSMVLMVRAQMNMGNIQEAVRVFLDNKVGQAQGYAREELMGLVLPDLLSKYTLPELFTATYYSINLKCGQKCDPC